MNIITKMTFLFLNHLNFPLVLKLMRLILVAKTKKTKDKKFRSEEHTSELQLPCNLVCRLLLEKKKKNLDINVVACAPAVSVDPLSPSGAHARRFVLLRRLAVECCPALHPVHEQYDPLNSHQR